MKTLITICLFALATMSLTAQTEKIPEKGTILQIENPSGQEYQHIHFPKRNLIIKPGGIASYNLVIGKKVIVTDVTTTKEGTTEIRVKPLNNTKFFKALSSVTLDYEKALKAKEIKLL